MLRDKRDLREKRHTSASCRLSNRDSQQPALLWRFSHLTPYGAVGNIVAKSEFGSELAKRQVSFEYDQNLIFGPCTSRLARQGAIGAICARTAIEARASQQAISHKQSRARTSISIFASCRAGCTDCCGDQQVYVLKFIETKD